MTSSVQEKKIDYLEEDPPISGQEWICVSFLSPEGVKNCTIRGFKFRGAFATRQEAEAHAKEIQDKLDPDFHIYVGEGFKWLPWDQDPETVENQEYHEKELNELMKSTKENLLLKKQHENERKKQKLQEAMLDKASATENKTKQRLQKKLMKRRMEQEKDVAPQQTEDTSNVDGKLTKLADDEKKIDEEKHEVEELDNSIHRLQNVYNKLLEKQKK